MFVNFITRPDLRAVELVHSVTGEIQLHLATLVTMEMGEPTFRGDGWSAWYGEMETTQDGTICRLSVHHRIPFAIRIFANGNASIQVPWSMLDLAQRALASMVPMVATVIEPRPMRSARRR